MQRLEVSGAVRYIYTSLGDKGLPVCLLVFGATDPLWGRTSSFTMFLDHTQRRATAGRTPLDE
jgi:hypothetical protein